MIRFKQHGRRMLAGGTLYESTCGEWHLYRESAKTRAGKPLRRWWHVTRRVKGDYFRSPLLGGGGSFKFKTRRAAAAAVNAMVAEESQQELFA